jgi:hypothetical protein
MFFRSDIASVNSPRSSAARTSGSRILREGSAHLAGGPFRTSASHVTPTESSSERRSDECLCQRSSRYDRGRAVNLTMILESDDDFGEMDHAQRAEILECDPGFAIRGAGV